MLEKLELPRNCIKNINIPLNKVFSQNTIKEFQIQECILFASINSDLIPMEKSNKTDSRYNEIHFVYIKINSLSIYSDLYRIVKDIYKSIKYQVVVIIQLHEMYKIGASCIIPGKKDFENNIIKNYVFTQWIYENFETKEIKNFFSEFTQLNNRKLDANSLYNSYYTLFSRLDSSLMKDDIRLRSSPFLRSESVIRIISGLLFDNPKFEDIKNTILNTTFHCEVFKHSNEKKFVTDENDTIMTYPIECIWYSIKHNEITNTALEKYRITDFEELYRKFLTKNVDSDDDDFDFGFDIIENEDDDDWDYDSIEDDDDCDDYEWRDEKWDALEDKYFNEDT